MKRIQFAVLALVLLLVGCVPALWASAADTAVHFADPVLEKRVCEQLGIPVGELTAADARKVENLNLGSEENSAEKITDLSGLEAFENLFNLSLFNNGVEDLTPLSGLARLEYLDAGGNRISDLEPLRDLPLKGLGLWGNAISDLYPLEKMTDMDWLSLDVNHITDLTPLRGMTKLNRLTLGTNEISDISALKNLRNLQYLNLGDNQIGDLGVLAGLDLIELYLYDNQVSDLTPLEAMHNMERLDLCNNRITDVSALAGMTKLQFLSLLGNQITDFNPIADLYDGIAEKDFELDAVTVMLRQGEDPDAVIAFDDPVLLEMLQSRLGVSGDITMGIAAGVTELNLEMDGNDWSIPRITSLNGMQYFTNLRWLSLGWAMNGGETQVDLAPLSGLIKLDTLQLHCDGLTDISQLAGLTNLRSLWIWGNDISDISMLSGMTQMEEIWLFGNSVSDISVLDGMPNLWRVLMANNNVSDLSPLAGHTMLEALEIANNPIWDYQAIADVYPQLTQKDFDINDPSSFNKPENPDAVVTFADPALERRVREQMNIPEGDITALDAARVTTLDLSMDWSRADVREDDVVTSLEGLQYFLNLQDLSLYCDDVTDLTPLAGLVRMTRLDMNENHRLADLSPLQNLTNLEILSFSNSQVEDISVLSGMTKLWYLTLRNSPIADYSPIEAIYPNLQQPDFAYGEVFEKYYQADDKSAVVIFPDPVLERKMRERIGKPDGDILWGDVVYLDSLYLKEEWQEEYPEGTLISDLTGLEYCLNLKSLEMGHNTITDLSPLAGMKKLEMIEAMDLGLTDISPLAGLTSLKFLDLSYNNIADVSPLAGLTCLQTLHLSNNPVADYEPLAGIYDSLTDKDFDLVDPASVVISFPDAALERGVRAAIGKPEGDITLQDALTVDWLSLSVEWKETYALGEQVTDLTGLENFRNLNALELQNDHVLDLAPLAGLHKLEILNLLNNGIADIGPLAQLGSLRWLELRGNTVTDVAALSGLTNLNGLLLSGNPIGDLSPLDEIYPNLTEKDF